MQEEIIEKFIVEEIIEKPINPYASHRITKVAITRKDYHPNISPLLSALSGWLVGVFVTGLLFMSACIAIIY